MLCESGEDMAAEMIAELLELFLEESGPKMQEMPALLAADERELIARHAHAISGASANLGGQRLFQLMQWIENGAPTRESAELSQAIEAGQTVFTATQEALEATIKDLSA